MKNVFTKYIYRWFLAVTCFCTQAPCLKTILASNDITKRGPHAGNMVGIFWTRGGGNGRRTDVCRLLLLNRDAYPGMRQSCLTRAGEQVADFLLPENSYLRGVSGFNDSTVVPFFPPSIRIPDKLGKMRNYLSSFPIFYNKCRCEEGGAFSKDNKIGQKEYFRAPLLHISN